MKNNKYQSIVILFLVLIVPVVGYLLLKTGTNHYKALPIFGERYAEEQVVNGQKKVDTVYHTIGDFSLWNQYGEPFNQDSLEGKIYVADFFFVDCQTICPKMSSQFTRLQQKLITTPDVVLVSHTVNPENDSVPVLKRYADEYGAVKGKWNLLTGGKKQIYDLARKSYIVNALQGDGGPDDFIHTELFILVDKQKRIRGFYDGTSREAVDVLIDEIKVLMKEEISGDSHKK